jgi:hypothetical protein
MVSNSEFYAAAAQVLPVLFLAAAVEFRLLVFGEEELRQLEIKRPVARNLFFAFITAFAWSFIGTIALGEWAALRVLHTNETFPESDPIVIGSLVSTGVALAFAPAWKLSDTLVKHSRSARAGATDPPFESRARRGTGVGWNTFRLIFVVILVVAVLAVPVVALIYLVS